MQVVRKEWSCARCVGRFAAGAALAAAGALVVPVGSPATTQLETPPQMIRVRPLETQLLRQINTVRATSGVGQVRRNRDLVAAAVAHSREMLTNGYFGHESWPQQPLDARLERFYPSSNAAYWAVGEVLQTAPVIPAAASVVDAWMRSADHRARLLDSRWRDVGVAVFASPRAPGVWGEAAATVVTVDFGVRSPLR